LPKHTLTAIDLRTQEPIGTFYSDTVPDWFSRRAPNDVPATRQVKALPPGTVTATVDDIALVIPQPERVAWWLGREPTLDELLYEKVKARRAAGDDSDE
jgi:hypothetical protein